MRSKPGVDSIPHRRARPTALVVVTGVVLLVLVRTAWMSDDSYITLRTIHNFLDGYGLRWNVNERVQTYTHPLWMLLLCGPVAITRDYFLTPIFCSLVVSFAAARLLLVRFTRGMGALVVGAMLIASRAFVDFSSSGLENPLTHLLLVLFCVVYFTRQWAARHIALLALITALAVLNRMDTVLLLGPALGYAWLTDRRLRTTALCAAGFVPLLAWFAFALAYYGFLFPNTAYAKLGAGIPAKELIAQGFCYFQDTATRDPVTLLVVVAGLLSPFVFRLPRERVLALGGLLYLLYVLRIGGDFMGGRFFSAPFVLGVLLLCRLPQRLPAARAYITAALLLSVSALAPEPPYLTGLAYGTHGVPRFFQGIANERAFYYPDTGLLHWDNKEGLPKGAGAIAGRYHAAHSAHQAVQEGIIGMCGYYAGPDVHIVDDLALADPLLARMPALYTPGWRIGHFYRTVPNGYLDVALTGNNTLADPDVHEFYDHLSLVTRGPLWSRERWKTILGFATGQYDHILDWEGWRFARLVAVPLAKVPGASSPAKGAAPAPKFGQWGLQIDLGAPSRENTVEITAVPDTAYYWAPTTPGMPMIPVPDPPDAPPMRYRLIVLRGDEFLETHDFDTAANVRLTLRPATTRHGFDNVRIFPFDNHERKHTLAYLGLSAGN